MPAPHLSCRAGTDDVRVDRLGRVEYQAAWDTQKAHAEARKNGGPDVLMLLEHPPVYTAGRRTRPEDRPTDGTPVVDVDRGGRITWHGEGQLVVYPIIKLAEPVDVVDYVRRLEEALIQVVRDAGVTTAGRVDGRSGVWVPEETKAVAPEASTRERKIAALGIRITRGVTMHGLALNCNNTLEHYEHIVACGIDDADVTTLSLELGRDITPADMTAPMVRELERALTGELVVADHTFATRPDPSKGLTRKVR